MMLKELMTISPNARKAESKKHQAKKSNEAELPLLTFLLPFCFNKQNTA